MRSRPSRPLAYASLALSMTLVGTYVALSKPLAAAIPVFLLAWLRFGIGGVAMANWLRPPPEEVPMTRSTRRLLFLESFFGNFLFTLCMMYGVSLTSAVSAGVVMAAIPAVVALMSWLFLGERVGTRIWVATACAALGIALLALGTPTSGFTPAGKASGFGYALLLGAVLCEAAYSVIGKRLTQTLEPRRITSLINLWGFALSTPLGLYTAWQFDFSSVPWTLWILLLFYALAACMWTVWLWMTGLRTIPAAQSGVFTVFLPMSATLVGIAVLGESLTGRHMLALLMALTGVLLATLPIRRT